VVLPKWVIGDVCRKVSSVIVVDMIAIRISEEVVSVGRYI
jgi:hypothetical protein